MSEKLNIQDLASLLAAKSGTTKKEAENFLREISDTLHEALLAEQLVKVKNLGTFKLTQVSDRESVDVVTGQRMLIPAHHKISFTPDNALAEAINEPFSLFETTELPPEEDEEDLEPLEPLESLPPLDTVESLKPLEHVESLKPLDTVESLKPLEPVEATTNQASPIIEKLPETETQPLENQTDFPITEPEEPPIFVPDSDYDFPMEEEDEENLSWWKRLGIWNILFIAIALLLAAAVGYLWWSDNSERVPIKEKPEIVEIKPEIPVAPIDTIEYTLPEDTLSTDEIVDTLSLVPIEIPKEEPIIPKEEPKIPETPKEKPIIPKEEPKIPEKPKEKPVITKPATTIKDSVTDSGRKYTIKSGETLRTIALNEYGNKAFWVYIYEENKSRITNPNNVGIGMQLTLPSANKYGIDANDPASIQRANNRAGQVK